MAKVTKAKISVSKPFKLNTDGIHTDFGIGVHTVDKSVADHWYVQHHSEVVDEWQEDDGKSAAGGDTKAAGSKDNKQPGKDDGKQSDDGKSAAGGDTKAAG